MTSANSYSWNLSIEKWIQCIVATSLCKAKVKSPSRGCKSCWLLTQGRRWSGCYCTFQFSELSNSTPQFWVKYDDFRFCILKLNRSWVFWAFAVIKLGIKLYLYPQTTLLASFSFESFFLLFHITSYKNCISADCIPLTSLNVI